jgi:uncharacterized protein
MLMATYHDPEMPDEVAVLVPPTFHVMIKPRGPICNLKCGYCYYLSKEKLYPGSSFRASVDVMETFFEQALATPDGPEVVFAWQGGEPTLIGLEFFQEMVTLQRKYRQKGRRVQNAIQTNGVLLDERWCRFLKEEKFTVGVSLDGPRDLHNAYRVDKGGAPTFDRVMAGLGLLRRFGVAFNILATVHAANAPYPLEVYRFFRDEVKAQHLQFIPIVEPERSILKAASARSVTGRQYGDFLIAIFDEWARRDVGKVFVQIFEEALSAWSGRQPALCVFRERCGTALVLEHNGDLYSCDHYVTPRHRLGNIRREGLMVMVGSDQQRAFGRAKQETLPDSCRTCEALFVCSGGCPKDRLSRLPLGKAQNVLCEGYKAFFTHVRPAMAYMARELKAGRPATSLARRTGLLRGTASARTKKGRDG